MLSVCQAVAASLFLILFRGSGIWHYFIQQPNAGDAANDWTSRAGSAREVGIASAEARERGATWIPRGKDDIADMFGGRELVDPGLVLASRWRPDGDPGVNADRAWTYSGIAKV
jgi:hypothetical protein